MATPTLAQAGVLALDDMAKGIATLVGSIDRFSEILPLIEVSGPSYRYQRETTAGDAQFLGIGSQITARNAALFTAYYQTLTTLISQAEVNGLVQATASAKHDQMQVQIESKARLLGRMYRAAIITGDGTANSFTGLVNSVDASQVVAAGSTNFALPMLDNVMDLVQDKDGDVDYVTMHSKAIRALDAQLRTAGGATINEFVTLPSGHKQRSYRGVPVFSNDNFAYNLGVGLNETVILAGTVDTDRTGSVGCAALTASNGRAGLEIEALGKLQFSDDEAVRLTWYCGFVQHSIKGLAAITGVKV
jgi:HK97 family phage major capsid protein